MIYFRVFFIGFSLTFAYHIDMLARAVRCIVMHLQQIQMKMASPPGLYTTLRLLTNQKYGYISVFIKKQTEKTRTCSTHLQAMPHEN